MTCPHCRAPVGIDERTCSACGSALLGPGSRVASRYRILEELGAGGMGVVFKARDEELDETVALKVLRPDARLGMQASRFRSEIRLARRIRHPNVCAIHEFGEEAGLLYISMELVDGRDLKRVLRENGPFHWEDGRLVALQIAAGLDAIHEAQVIHRDLKPANIMKDSKGVVRIMDFGIAKAWNPETGSDFTKTGHVVGSPEYMSPEQIQDAILDFRSDLYSFGVVLYEIFTGRLPFAAESAVEVMHKHLSEPPPLDSEAASRIPEALLPILRKALAKDRGDRYASAAEMRRALEQTRTDSPTPFVPVPTPHRVRSRPDVARLLIPQLLRALGHASAAVRRDAALTLGSTESDSALVRTALDGARGDDDPGVRAAALESLQKLPATAPAPPPAPQPPEPPGPRDPISGEGTVVHPVPKAPSPPSPPQPPQPSPPSPPPPSPPPPRPQPPSLQPSSPALPPPPLHPPQPRQPGPPPEPASLALPPPPPPAPPEKPKEMPVRPPLRPRPAPRRQAKRLAQPMVIAAASVSLLAVVVWLLYRPTETAPAPTPIVAASPSPPSEPAPSPDETLPPASPTSPAQFPIAPVPSPPQPTPHQRISPPPPTPAPTPTTATSPSPPSDPTPSPDEALPPPTPISPTPIAPVPSPPQPTPPPFGYLVEWSDPDLQRPKSPELQAASSTMADQLALRGTVELRVLVDEKGSVADVEVVRVACRQKGGQDVAVFGAGQIKEFERILVEAARKSAARWRFTPPTKLGVPVRVWKPAHIDF